MVDLANLIACAKDERFSNEYMGNLLRAYLPELETISARPEALPIPTSERLPEYQQNVLLWLVTVDPKNSGWVLGQRSSHEEGKFWDGERYRPMQWITHWKPLPAAPSIPSPLARSTELPPASYGPNAQDNSGSITDKPKGLPPYPLAHLPGCEWPVCNCNGRWNCKVREPQGESS